MKFKYLVNKLRKIIVARCYIYEYDLLELDITKSTYELPEGYQFRYAKDIPKEFLIEFARNYRKKGYYEKIILKNLTDENVIGIGITYQNKEIAMLSWLYMKLTPSTKGIEKLPVYKNCFYPMDGWVVENHRGKGFHKYSIYKRFLEAQKAGKKYGYGLVYLSNVPAIKDNNKYGTIIGKSLLINIGYKFTINIYNLKHSNLYLKKHVKLG